MKHDLKITLFIVMLFFLSQVFGLYTISQYIGVEKQQIPGTNETTVVISHPDTIAGPPPEIKNWDAIIFIGIAVAIGTCLVLLLVKFKKTNLWKLWFFLAVTFSVAITLNVYFNKSIFIVIAVAAILAVFKIFRPNVIIHNLTEILMYAGIAVLFVSLFNIVFAFVLLALISIYDMIAVWQSKHMITLAKFQTGSKAFAGLSIPYIPGKKIPDKASAAQKKAASLEPKNAILGGGDITFPLIFSGVVMEHLIRTEELTKSTAFLKTSVISIFVTLALFLIFYFAKKDKFYPAMPFLSAGCVIGYLVVLLF